MRKLLVQVRDKIYPFHKYVLKSILILCILVLAFVIRYQNIEQIPPGQFTSNDAYLYAWQTQIIIDNGVLPARDMHRWLPLGRDNQQLLPLWSYVIAYAYKSVGWLFPKLTPYHIQLYAPPILFCLGLAILCLFLTRIYSIYFAIVVGVVLATLPGSIDRSGIGFGDRDTWCWCIGVLTIISFLWKEHLKSSIHRYIITALSGVIVLLGGLSWEGYGCFLLIILAIELWKYCTTQTELHLSEYILWALIFVPALYIISPVYRSGYGFSTHAIAMMLYAPLGVLILRSTRYLMLRYIKRLQPHGKILACGLTILGIASGIGYFIIHSPDFESTAFAFSESLVMQDISELADPDMQYWILRYGSIFVIGSFGLIAMCLHLWGTKGIPLAFSLLLFTFTTFLRDIVNNWFNNTQACDRLFVISCGLIVFSLALICLNDNTQNIKNKTRTDRFIIIATLAWLLIWLGLSRGGLRYDFFVGVPLAICTAWITWQLPSAYRKNRLTQNKRKILSILAIAATFIPIAALIPILFWAPLGGFTNQLVQETNLKRYPIPGTGAIEEAITWMKDELPSDTVVATGWGYGSIINVMGGVKTITDQDTYIPYWIYLYYRHLYCAQDIDEALTFLKTHNATHIMFIRELLINKAHVFSKIASDKKKDRQFEFVPLAVLPKTKNMPQRMLRIQKTPFRYIDAIELGTTPIPDSLTAQLKEGGTAQIPYAVIKDSKRQFYKNNDNRYEHGGTILHYDSENKLRSAMYLSNIGLQSLPVKLFLLGEAQNIFVPIYPKDKNEIAEVKIWEIHYPPHIKTNPKYLATQPEELDAK